MSSLFDTGCDDAAGDARPTVETVDTRIAAVDRYMGELDRALARAPTTLPRRRAWDTLYGKWRQFSEGGALAGVGVADRYLTVAGHFAAQLGSKAPAPPAAAVVVNVPAAKTPSHWLRWALVVGGLGTAGYFGWRWWASRRAGPPAPTATAGTIEEVLPGQAGHYPAAAGPGLDLADSVRVLSANAANAPPGWVRDDVIWANATQAVRPYWDRYPDPQAVVVQVYRRMGGRSTGAAS